jgi:signal transduction histidine kinase
MSEELSVLMEHENRGERVAPLSTNLRYFPAGAAPAGLAELPAGAFRRLRFEGKILQALTAADRAGGVHVLTHDMSLAEHREHSLLLSLIAGVSMASAAAWWVAGKLARRTLSPLTGLVEQIRGIDPLQPTQRPVARTGDVDVDVIPDAVNALVQELDHVLQRERAFADAASHELRTPLAVVRGAIDLLRERGDAPSPVIDRMERAARRAHEDLDALLALSPARVPAAAKLVDLRDLLPAAAEPYLREGTARVVWAWKAPSEARVEPAALAIVFTNLLRNALRAAPQGEVRIEADARGVRIVDDGEGLPAGWPAASEPRGRGLGLLIAQTLAERHGWRLSVEPAEPSGTRASLFLASDDSL